MTNPHSEEYLARIRELRDDWIDDIPAEIIHSTHPVYGRSPIFKCRRGWFMGVIAYFELGLVEGHLTKDSPPVKAYAEFRKYMDETNFQKRSLTTTEDIRRGNDVLTAMINELESKIPHS